MALKNPLTTANDVPDKVEKVTCNCDTLWSLAHQFSYLRLSNKKSENEYQLVNLYAARAKRIAATYARFYLEIEEGGDPSKIGRYYWMALGAFASKTVGCLLDSWQVEVPYKAGFGRKVGNGLGQGNFWLFNDIATSHWLYSNYPEHFHEGMACGKKRHIENLEKPVQKIVNDLPWAEDSIGTIDGFTPSDDIIEGFDLIKAVENSTVDNKKQKLQYDQLIAIAKHEQGAILQKLIYDDFWFDFWTSIQRWPVISSMSPDFEINFSHLCSTKDPKILSKAPENMVVEDFESRMDWIKQVANKFHKLMISDHDFVKSELNFIANWVDAPDADMVF